MTAGWYDHLRSTHLYRAFLRHRVWAAERILAAPWLQGGLAVCTLVITWLALPTALGFLPVTLIAAPFGEGVVISIIALYVFVMFVAMGSIFGRTLADIAPVFFTILWAIFGKTHLAQKHLAETKSDLRDWEELHA